MKRGVLYISYDGVLEPLGQSQVLAYLKRLALRRRIHLISFEKASDWADLAERQRIASEITRSGISWHPLRYYKKPSVLATSWNIACGLTLGFWLRMRHRLPIVHARSYVAGVMALVLKRIGGMKFIFDMRGFWADERIDGGLWPPGGCMYHMTKAIEQRLLVGADHVVSLTHAAVREMRRFNYLQGRMPPFTVIPTCADLTHFSPASPCVVEARSEGFVLGYVGTAGTWYLFDEAVYCFLQLRQMRPDARFLIVNRAEQSWIRERLSAAGVPASVVELTSASYAEVPGFIARMDAGIFFIKPVYSKQASAPTKLAEFLGCGVPCLSNAGVGDMEEILKVERVGVALRTFDAASVDTALRNLLALVADPSTRARCATAAVINFSLDEGVRRYESIYDAV